MVLRPADTGGGWPGEVIFSQYLGHDVQYLIRCGGREITAHVPSHGGIFAEGAAVTLHVAPKSLFVFPEAV